DDARAEWVEVAWPNGARERFEGDFAAGRSVLLKQGEGRARALVVRAGRLPDPLSAAERAARNFLAVVGKPLPAVDLISASGETAPLRSLLRPGRRTLLHLWTTWSPASGRELKDLESLRPRLAEQGIDVVSLNLDVDG